MGYQSIPLPLSVDLSHPGIFNDSLRVSIRVSSGNFSTASYRNQTALTLVAGLRALKTELSSLSFTSNNLGNFSLTITVDDYPVGATFVSTVSLTFNIRYQRL